MRKANEITQDQMNVIATYMDDEVREQISFKFAPCANEFFLRKYCEEVPEFADILEDEFGIEFDENWNLVKNESRENEIEYGEPTKYDLVQKYSKIGSFGNTFRASYKWIPEELEEELTAEQLAKLTDAFYDCYGAGKNDKRED